MLAYKSNAGVRLVSRNGIEHTYRHPEPAATLATLPPRTMVLDCELAVFDAQLRSRFEWLRDRPTALATPPVLIAFDLLYLKGRDLRRLPLRGRRARLEDLLDGADRFMWSGAWPWTGAKRGTRS